MLYIHDRLQTRWTSGKCLCFALIVSTAIPPSPIAHSSLCVVLLIPPEEPLSGFQKSSSSQISRYTSKASLLQFPSGVKTYLWNVPSTQMAAGGESERRTLMVTSHMTAATFLLRQNILCASHVVHPSCLISFWWVVVCSGWRTRTDPRRVVSWANNKPSTRLEDGLIWDLCTTEI